MAQFLHGYPPTPTRTPTPTPTPTPTSTPPNPPIELPNQPPDLALPIQQPLPLPNALLLEPQNKPPDLALPVEQPLPLPNAQQQNNLDFRTLVVAFCLTGATEIAAQSIQNHTARPLYFHSLCLMLVLAFASIFVAKYIAPTQPNAARVLNNLGVFFGVTGFFFSVTISFPLCLKIISWIIYVFSLLAILICNRPPALFGLPL